MLSRLRAYKHHPADLHIHDPALYAEIDRVWYSLEDALLAAGFELVDPRVLGRESICREILPGYDYQRRFGNCIPDFSKDGEWIDAKLSKWGDVGRYVGKCERLVVLYLKEERGTPPWEVRHASWYYPELRERGREDVVERIGRLERRFVEVV